MPVAGQRTLTVITHGPVLASANEAPEVKTEVACTTRGVTLNLTIMHISDGGAAKNALWRPKVSVILVLRQDVVFQTAWRMRRPNGAEVDHTQTPPYPDQRYPIVMTTTLRSASDQKP